jgi:hypothetical protein
MKRNLFSLSHYNLLTAGYGNLTPLSWWEVLPGDTQQISSSLLIRSTPLVAPVMHPVRVRLHYWFVPNRLIWEDWEDFITGGDDGTFEASPPSFSTAGGTIEPGDFEELMGIPPGDYSGVSDLVYSALPFRAYNLIYNEMYRDQDLVDELPISTSSGADVTTTKQMQRVSWSKDYFTTARPWSSKGNEILIPIGTSAPLKGIGVAPTSTPGTDVNINETGGPPATQYAGAFQSASSDLRMAEDLNHPGYPNMWADLSQATGVSVRDLRNYLAMQRYQEARAQFGSRYSEYLKYLVPGIGNLDSRLQEPEYIGGGSSTISFSEILQTQRSDTGETPLGTMAGHGISAQRTRRIRKFFPEHGIVMVLMSVVPKSIYANQVERKWHRLNKEMYFQKELQYIGEQPITNREIYNLHSDPTGIFGYNNRYDEYRWAPSSIHGEMFNTADGWHFARIFESDPALNKSFIECNPALRPYADQTGDPLYIMAQHSVQARRILSQWATPKTF